MKEKHPITFELWQRGKGRGERGGGGKVHRNFGMVTIRLLVMEQIHFVVLFSVVVVLFSVDFFFCFVTATIVMSSIPDLIIDSFSGHSPHYECAPRPSGLWARWWLCVGDNGTSAVQS